MVNGPTFSFGWVKLAVLFLAHSPPPMMDDINRTPFSICHPLKVNQIGFMSAASGRPTTGQETS